MRARHAALVTVRARYVSDGATSLPHGLHQPGGPRPTPSSCGAHSAWLSASQTYKRGSAPPPRSGVPKKTLNSSGLEVSHTWGRRLPRGAAGLLRMSSKHRSADSRLVAAALESGCRTACTATDTPARGPGPRG